ncbi:retrotransposon protein [Hordeum vulgare]|nr:retrotransposon protein [Hordeum vulgare]
MDIEILYAELKKAQQEAEQQKVAAERASPELAQEKIYRGKDHTWVVEEDLNGENFTTWAIKVEADLDAAGLWEAVVPPKDAALAVITKKDKPARAYLLRALANDLLLQVAAKKTAAEI